MSEPSKGILSALMVMGAQSPERAMSSEDLAIKLGMSIGVVESELKALINAGYARTAAGPGRLRVYLTGTGVITASSTYS
jgi:DNA-binding IscR family transcriptional regulator